MTTVRLATGSTIAAMALVGCSADTTPDIDTARGPSETSRAAAANSSSDSTPVAVGSTGSTVEPAPEPAPPPTQPPAVVGATLTLATVTLSGEPVPDVPVEVQRMEPCGPDGSPIGAAVTFEASGTTRADGLFAFDVEPGCYSFRMDPPLGTSPVPEGMHSVVVEPGEQATGQLRYYGVTLCDVDAQAIADALELPDYVRAAEAVATECVREWVVMSWNVPGDSQRLVTSRTGSWTTYVEFPHRMCWDQAEADGVPPELRRYFSLC